MRRLPDVVILPRLRRCPLLVLLLLLGCRGPARPYDVLAPHVANLRAQFNQDVGNVRVVILPAPT